MPDMLKRDLKHVSPDKEIQEYKFIQQNAKSPSLNHIYFKIVKGGHLSWVNTLDFDNTVSGSSDRESILSLKDI